MPNPTTDTYLRCLRQGNGLEKKKKTCLFMPFLFMAAIRSSYYKI